MEANDIGFKKAEVVAKTQFLPKYKELQSTDYSEGEISIPVINNCRIIIDILKIISSI